MWQTGTGTILLLLNRASLGLELGLEPSPPCSPLKLGYRQLHTQNLLLQLQKKTHFIFVYLGGSGGCLFCQTYLDFRELLLDQEANLIPVVPGVIEAAAGGLPISPSSARLLVISSHWLGNVPVSNEPASDKTVETQGCSFLNSGHTHKCVRGY